MPNASAEVRAEAAGGGPNIPIDEGGRPHTAAAALCLLARLHRVAAEPAALMHELGKSPSEPWSVEDLLLAAKQLGLQAKLSRTPAERLALSALPALAFLRDGRAVVLAQCDGQRVLVQDPSGQLQGGRPVIEPLVTFAAQWTGELLLVTSRASVASDLARFDFSWFIPSLVKYRKLFGEVLVISLFLQLFALVSPLFFQVVMDKVLVHRGLTTLDVLVIGLLVVVVFESVLTALRTYVVDNTADVITELASEGTDGVSSSVTYTLAANVENLTLTGTSAINGSGNALNNLLTGNNAANTLDGGGGADTLVGSAGNDSYVVGTGDTVSEAASGGTDTVQSSITWTLGNEFENLTLTGAGVINGTGNTLGNVLTGNGANNTLTGNAGNDTLDGAAGSDILIGGVGNDSYVLGRGYGADSIQENDATAGNVDVLQFLSGVATDQIWLRKVSNDLEVSIIGTSDKATLTNWYLGNQYHVEQFKTSDGKTLLDSKMQNLVSAMAGFAPPAAGQTTLPPNYQTALAPVIAANWNG